MENILRCLILAFAAGTSCKVFFETIVPMRRWRYPWVSYTAIPAFAAVQLINAFTPIPPYVLQPVRLIIAVAVVAQIYFQMRITRNLILSVLYCGIYWCISTAIVSVFYFFCGAGYMYESQRRVIENLTETMNLCLMMAFHAHYRSRIRGLARSFWKKLSLLPFLCLAIMVAFNLLSTDGTATNKYAILAMVSGIVTLNIILLYFVMRMAEKEETLQKLQLRAERTHSQMDMYHTMQSQYEQQRRFLHDYKNQLNCIQGLLNCGRTEEASEYIARMTGTRQAQFGDINTNHAVVNIILNQKYQTARDREIAMAFVINDLSGLVMPEEDLVTLLTNPLDNAIEACEKSITRSIQFKMVMEDGQLILSVRNPVSSPVLIRNNTVVTSKKDPVSHGIGLSNVDTVVRKYHGTSVLKCEDGWFSFSVILPCST